MFEAVSSCRQIERVLRACNKWQNQENFIDWKHARARFYAESATIL